MKKIGSVALLAALVLLPSVAAAKSKPSLAPLPAVSEGPGGLAIAAEVGGDAVSSWDVDNRVRFIILTAKLSNTPDVVARIRPQVIHSLIDERLQVQEAAKNSITVTDKDVAGATASIEEQRSMPPGAIAAMLTASHIPESTFTDQLRAQLAWNKLLVKKVRPQVFISDDEIQLAGRKMALPDSHAPQEMKIAVLSLPVDKPARDAEMHRLSDKLVREVRAGASFEEVSRQFSTGSANQGGAAASFWVQPEQLDPIVAHALLGAKAGTVTEPLRTDAGYTIVKVYDTRSLGKEAAAPQKELEILLKEILLKLKPDASNKEADTLLQIGEDFARHPGTCAEKGIAGVENLDDFSIEVTMYDNKLSQLPAALKAVAEGMKVGDISTPFASDEGIRLYMLCGKKEVEPSVDRERVYGMLMQQKMELEAQKYMRNLRRDTFIEVR